MSTSHHGSNPSFHSFLTVVTWIAIAVGYHQLKTLTPLMEVLATGLLKLSFMSVIFGGVTMLVTVLLWQEIPWLQRMERYEPWILAGPAGLITLYMTFVY